MVKGYRGGRFGRFARSAVNTAAAIGKYVTSGNRAGPQTRSIMRKRVAAGTRTASKMLQYRAKKQNLVRKTVRSSMGGLPSFSKFQLANRPNKTVLAMKRVSAPNYYVVNGSEQIVNSEGFQNAGVYTWLGKTDMTTILATVPGAGGSYPNAPKRCHVESVVNELLMTNSSLATQYIDIYDIVRKRDAGYTSGGPGPTGTPLEAWKVGVSDQSPTSPDFTAWQNVSSLPTDSKLFSDYFRIVKRSYVGLVAGATHRHQVILKPNRIIDSELLQRANGDLAGYTVYTLLVINGQPASIKDEAGAIVTTATTALDVVNSRRIKYSYVQDNTNIWNVYDNLSSLVGEVITQPSLGTFVPNAIV